jgi:exodeoxyribonuclease-3
MAHGSQVIEGSQVSNGISPFGGQNPHELKLFTLNVSGPSLSRATRIVHFLSELDPDVIVLTETRDTPGTRHILDSYREAGYEVVAPSTIESGERGVAIVHRVKGEPGGGAVTVDLAHRLLIVRLALDVPVTMIGAYVPSRDASVAKITRKQTFLSQMVSLLKGLPDQECVILMGDFNVIGRSHEPKYSSFRSWEYESLVEIASCGLVDAFAELHPGVSAHSWFGRTGHGYRYDYGFLSQRWSTRLLHCAYVDEPRHQGLSDHSGLLMTVATSDTPPLAGDDGRAGRPRTPRLLLAPGTRY